MTSNRRNSQRGMSLAEVLVAVAIFALIFVAALMIYDRSNRVFKTGMESADVQQNTRIAFDKMLSDLRMAGFDFDRDGVPTAEGEMQQVDEQIEYAGTRAITIRANLNYDEPGTNSGRDATLEAPNSQFPIVTTSNDEIVTYALVSDNGPNDDEIVFYADVTDGDVATRETFAAAAGEVEDEIVIDNVDLCTGGTCDNPPYTLMRITLDGKGQPVRTPLANNIRSMEFSYFSDSAGHTALAIAEPGGGQWDPANPAASEATRNIRARVRAIDVTVIGMTEAADPGYTDPNETIASAAGFRKYRLETLIAPRNMGKRGLREQQTAAPGPPTLTAVCIGYCEGVRLTWTAPPNNPLFGTVESYVVLWDTDTTKADTEPPLYAIPVGLANYYDLFHSTLDANTEYRFSVAASNSWGTTYSNQVIKGKPVNMTTQKSPTGLTATNEPSPLENQIDLGWTMPTENVPGEDVGSCINLAGGTSTINLLPQYSEVRGVEVWRSFGDMNFDPLASPLPSTTVKVAETSGPATSYSDTTAANCQDYYYRVRIAEPCCEDPATQNAGGGKPWSDFFPPVGDPAIHGRAASNVKPSAPINLAVLSSSSCLAGSCRVDLRWPEVKTNVNGGPIAVASYVVEVDQDGTPYGLSPYSATALTGLATDAGIATYSVLNLPQTNGATGSPFEYTFRVRAEQCALQSDPSPEDKFPKCDFGSGGIVVVTMDAFSGNGSPGSPFELEDSGTITFNVSNGALIQSVSATSVVSATGAPFMDLGSATGPAATLNLAWPGGADGTVYRIDYTIIDDAGCQTTGSVWVTDILIACPFITPVQFFPDFANDRISFSLSNQFSQTIRVRGVDFVWSKAASGVPANRTINVTAVQYPTGAGTLGPGTLAGQFIQPGGLVVSNAPATVANIGASDVTGNYRIRVDFNAQGNTHPTANPITEVTMRWRLTTDALTDPDRTCKVFP